MPMTKMALLMLGFTWSAMAGTSCDSNALGVDLARARCLFERGFDQQNAGKTKEAEADYLGAVELWKSAGARFTPHRATALLQLAGLYQMDGRWSDAVARASESVDLFRATLGEHHERTAAAIVRLATDYMMTGEETKADRLFAAVLAPGSGLSESDRALALNTLGVRATLRGDYQTGIDLLRQAERAMAAGGEQDPAYGATVCNLAAAYILTGDTARAAPLLKKSRAIYTATLGPRHPRMASLLLQEGAMALADHKYGEAERPLRQADEIAETIFPNDSTELASYRSTLGLAYLRTGKLDAADPLLSWSLDVQRTTYRGPHREVAVSLNHLATLRAAQHRDREAGQLYEEAIGMYERTLGPKSSELKNALDEYARFAKSTRNDTLARSLQRRAKSIHSSFL